MSKFIFRRIGASVINHGIAFLTFIMLAQDPQNRENKLLLLGLWWIGYLIAIGVPLLVMKNRTLGDAIMQIKYKGIFPEIFVGWRVFFRAFLGSTFIYGTWSVINVYSFMVVLIWSYLIFVFNLRMSNDFDTVIDLITQIKPSSAPISKAH